MIPLIYGLYVGISETVQRALISKYVSEHNRGTAFGFYGLIVGVCLLIGNVAFGFLYEKIIIIKNTHLLVLEIRLLF